MTVIASGSGFRVGECFVVEGIFWQMDGPLNPEIGTIKLLHGLTALSSKAT